MLTIYVSHQLGLCTTRLTFVSAASSFSMSACTEKQVELPTIMPSSARAAVQPARPTVRLHRLLSILKLHLITIAEHDCVGCCCCLNHFVEHNCILTYLCRTVQNIKAHVMLYLKITIFIKVAPEISFKIFGCT